MNRIFVYISSWNNFGGEPGMGLYRFYPDTGELCFQKMQCEGISCSVTCVDREHKVLYVCNEVASLSESGGGGGCVIAYRIQEDGTLTELNRGLTFCPNPAYASLDRDGRRLLVANHSGHGVVTKLVKKNGSFQCRLEYDDSLLEMFGLEYDGSFGKILDVVKHTGCGPRPQQTHARPHSVLPSPLAALYVVCDKGNDTIYMYQIMQGKLTECARYLDIPGSMPRYCVFHPAKPWFFVNYEGCTSLSAFSYDTSGRFSLNCTKESVEHGGNCREKCHDEGQGLVMHPSGRYIYNLLKGPEIIAVFRINEETGEVQLIQNRKVSRGEWLRSGAVSPDGDYLITTCLKSGDIEVFRILNDGTLEETGMLSSQSAAAYVTFLEVQDDVLAFCH